MDIDAAVAEIKRRPYRIELVPESDGTWFVEVIEFPGCISAGSTREEALKNIDDAMDGWIRVLLADGEPIPEPIQTRKFSGKTVVRLGTRLHREASVAAEREGISLNHFVTTAVAQAVGREESVDATKRGRRLK